jgi:hypothetical protein
MDHQHPKVDRSNGGERTSLSMISLILTAQLAKLILFFELLQLFYVVKCQDG